MNRGNMDLGMIECEGWWNQAGLGDQPMKPLRLSIQSGKIEGTGYDVVGMFSLSGYITEGKAVYMVKRYAGRHSVDYYGEYDKKGILFGKWEISDQTGFWEIRIRQNRESIEVILKNSIPQIEDAPEHQIAI